MKQEAERLAIQSEALCEDSHCGAFKCIDGDRYCGIMDAVDGKINPDKVNHDCPFFQAALDLTHQRIALTLDDIITQATLNNVK